MPRDDQQGYWSPIKYSINLKTGGESKDELYIITMINCGLRLQENNGIGGPYTNNWIVTYSKLKINNNKTKQKIIITTTLIAINVKKKKKKKSCCLNFFK